METTPQTPTFPTSQTPAPIAPPTRALPAEAALLRDAARSVRSAPGGLLLVDEHGTLLFVNPAARRFLPGAEPGSPLAHDTLPAWLSAAHDRAADSARGPAGARELDAHRAPLGDGRTAWWLTDVTAEADARGLLDAERERTRFLAEASSRLMSSLNLRRCVRTTAELAARHLADAAVVITPPARHRLTLTRSDGGGRAQEELLPVTVEDVPGLAEALAGFPPVPSRWIDPSQAPGWLVGEGFGELGSLVVTPLPGNGVPAGALVLLRRAGRPGFSNEEEAFARIFAARAGAAISAASLFAEQSAVAALLQQDLLPPELTDLDGVELAAAYRPSRVTQQVGGDFIDFYPGGEPGEQGMVVLGDVCGKGLEAAVLTGRIRTTLAALRHVETGHRRLLELLNATLLSDAHARFATLVLVSVCDRPDGGAALRITSAGHPPPFVVRRGGTVETVDTRGTLIGAMEHVETTTAEVPLAPGETCLLYSDGITEVRGGLDGREMFGEERLHAALGECADLPAAAVVERVDMMTAEWAGEGFQDDMTLLAVSVPRHARPAPVGAAVSQRPGRPA